MREIINWLFYIWIFFGTFAFLYFILSGWFLAWKYVSKEITVAEHVTVMFKQTSNKEKRCILGMLILGPYGAYVSIKAIQGMRRDIKQLFDD